MRYLLFKTIINLKQVKMSTQAKSKGKVNTNVKTLTNYQIEVIGTNKALKQEYKTLGGCLKVLWFFRDEINLPRKYQLVVKAAREDNEIYKGLKNDVRTSKSGNYAPFFVLQALYKSFKPEVKKAKKAKAKTEAKEPTKKLVPIAKKTVKELRDIAKSNEVKGYSKMNKEQLIKAVIKR